MMVYVPEGQMFSDPGNDGAVMAAWERFVDGDARPSDALRDLVDSSWQRCQEHQVNPAQRSAPPPAGESVLHDLRQRHVELLEAGAPIMACARDFLAETGTVMALADAHSTILGMEGDGPTLDAAGSIHLLPGVTWAERICGTNAIGTALAVGAPVQIHSAEHYCAGIKRWTCSATVIRHPLDGEIIGVVDASGLSESYSRQSLALVVTTASRIESRLSMREMERRYRLLDTAMRRWSGETAGLVLFDRRGYPLKANENAQMAITALGGELDLARPRRLRALELDERDEVRGLSQAAGLPGWMRAEWLAPVEEGGARLGTLLILPLPSLARLSAHRGDKARAASVAVAPAQGFAGVVTGDAGLQEAVRKATQLARSRIPVLLLGETGVGKEEFAQGIHQAGVSAAGAYVALNCGGLSRELLASELFGYVDGAFTGARRGGQVGKIEAANGGTLFLDEIGEMPLDLQPHLLRVLELGEIQRLGENAPRKVNFRLIAATHRDLRQEVAAGRFRMDLYYRVAVTSIRIPPLRERGQDVDLLARHFIRHFSQLHQLPAPQLDEALLARLRAYPWPGNVRELRNVIESMLLMADGSWLHEHDLPLELLEASMPDRDAAMLTATDSASMEAAERQMICRAIAASRGNLTRAARQLQIAKSTLYVKLKRYGLEAEVLNVRQTI